MLVQVDKIVKTIQLLTKCQSEKKIINFSSIFFHCRCDLNFVQNLIYRQSGILYKGERRTYESFSNKITNRISNSVYIVERMKRLGKLDKHDGCVNCLNFNKSGNLLVTGSDDLKVMYLLSTTLLWFGFSDDHSFISF